MNERKVLLEYVGSNVTESRQMNVFDWQVSGLAKIPGLICSAAQLCVHPSNSSRHALPNDIDLLGSVALSHFQRSLSSYNCWGMSNRSVGG